MKSIGYELEKDLTERRTNLEYLLYRELDTKFKSMSMITKHCRVADRAYELDVVLREKLKSAAAARLP